MNIKSEKPVNAEIKVQNSNNLLAFQSQLEWIIYE